MMKKALFFVLVVLVLSACSTSKPLYSWYGYESASYKYFRDQSPKSLEKLKGEYEHILQQQRSVRGVPPPGIYAERGFIAIKEGYTQMGKEYLKLEVERYPESEVFIGRIIKELEDEE